MSRGLLTVVGLVALMFLGLQLISTETAGLDTDVTNSTAYNTSATAVNTLFAGAAAIPVAFMAVMLMVTSKAIMIVQPGPISV